MEMTDASLAQENLRHHEPSASPDDYALRDKIAVTPICLEGMTRPRMVEI